MDDSLERGHIPKHVKLLARANSCFAVSRPEELEGVDPVVVPNEPELIDVIFALFHLAFGPPWCAVRASLGDPAPVEQLTGDTRHPVYLAENPKHISPGRETYLWIVLPDEDSSLDIAIYPSTVFFKTTVDV